MAISIETTQNVAIDYDIASIGDRILSYIVDLFVLFGYLIGMFMIVTAAADEPGAAIVTIVLIPVFFYDLLCEVLLDGQSFGKKALRIKVVKVDGTEPSLGAYLLRWLLRSVDGFFMIGLILIAVGGKGQRLGDIAAGTTVIKLRPRLTLDETLMPDVDEEYEPTYPEVTKLSDHDIAIIREVWAAGRTQETRATIEALAARVAQVMGVEEVLTSSASPGPDAFLDTVVRDYTYYTQGLVSGAMRR